LYKDNGRTAFHYENGFIARITPPQNNPKQTDLMIGSAVFQEIQVSCFLNDTAAVSRNEAVLNFITGRGNVTRTEVETFYCNGIRDFISGMVDEEFNKVSFRLDTGLAISYTVDLIRNAQNGQYVINYGGVETNGEIRTVTGNSLDALSSEMRNGLRKSDFTQLSIDQVRAQATLIPAATLSDAALTEIKNIFTRFFTDLNLSAYTAVMETYRVMFDVLLNTRNTKYTHVSSRCERLLTGLSEALAQKSFYRQQNLALHYYPYP